MLILTYMLTDMWQYEDLLLEMIMPKNICLIPVIGKYQWVCSEMLLFLLLLAGLVC